MRSIHKQILVAGMMLLAAFAASAQHGENAVLLVASPAMQGFYSEAALLVVQKRNAHVGFILNRPSGLEVAAVFAADPHSAKVAEPIYFGGPESAESMFAVVRRDPGEGSRRLFGEVFVTISSATVDRIIEQTPNDARYVAGYVAWAPGELKKQIDAGMWLVAEPDASQIFRKDVDAMWEELVLRLNNSL